ncbi:aldehyde dehydrogenase family protein [Streptomyces calidiresistens]|uniref:Aldehyde dehydrogenase family protein n=1 Tax=Streptomyces calidiresistens TaxID=1485586 RepID=A0A7W3XV75_9ACTN|nr:aldehyde dehydrogenase family protein [Streptomyces calidiresistens]MBB0228459.1 aldehyde dehydrogenase family protein [Streptomyces calidiresistens]
MRDIDHLYIDGTRTRPLEGTVTERTHPADGSPTGRVVMGGAADVDRAVTAAERAFDTWSRTTPAERIALLENVLAEFDRRSEELVEAVTEDMGAPVTLAREGHVPTGRLQITGTIEAAKGYAFEERHGSTVIRREPVGPAGLITPWNFPVLQMAGKTASALAAGCTVVLKPAELAARCATLFAEIMDAAGTPAGVFNLVHGDGAGAGNALASHPGIGVVSFTGSLATAVRVTTAAAPTMKRVLTELGGKSPHILLPDADFGIAVATVRQWMMAMTGQLCSAPTRTLVPRARLEEFLSVLVPSLEALTVGDPRDPATDMGPLVSGTQWNTVQEWIRRGLSEGARVVTGGPGKPEVPAALEAGHHVRPTVFTDVTNDMAIAREEIFGPVMAVIAYDTVEEAIAIANDTPYGLAAYVVGADRERVDEVAARVRAGAVLLNDAEFDWNAPWGGYKQSGNGREFGVEGMVGFLETKVVHGG